MNRARCLRITVALLMTLALCACETLQDMTDWIGGDHEKKPIEGKRIDVLADAEHVKPDVSLKDTAITLPAAQANSEWAQAGGGPVGITGNLTLSDLSHDDSKTIGDGNGWEEPLYPSPVVADGKVFAADAKGYITAHEAAHISNILWKNSSAVGKDEPDMLGGGLAYAGGKLFATFGRGFVMAFDAATGKELWRQPIGLPLRAAPKVSGDKVYVLSIDNQLFALDTEHGTQLWSSRGINENAGFLASTSPAATDAIVIAPYSSGEIHAIDSVSGQDIWADSLLLARRTVATSAFSGIGGNPIIADGVLYGAGSSGIFAAIELSTGRRIWEQDISSLNTPWIAGDYIYLISEDDEVICIFRADGRIKWVRQLQVYDDPIKHRHPYVWRGPILASDRLLIADTFGSMLALSPQDGSLLATIDIPENITDAPVIANGRLYLLTQDATLHVLY